MRFVVAALFIVLLGGCGYHVEGSASRLPSDVRLLWVELFHNRTLEPFLENAMTDAVTDRFARGRALTLVRSAHQADAVFSGIVTDYETLPISFDRLDRILEYRSTMTVSASVRRVSDGSALWRGTLSWSEGYPAHIDKAVQRDNELAAVRVISERLADTLYSRIIEDF